MGSKFLLEITHRSLKSKIQTQEHKEAQNHEAKLNTGKKTRTTSLVAHRAKHATIWQTQKGAHGLKYNVGEMGHRWKNIMVGQTVTQEKMRGKS